MKSILTALTADIGQTSLRDQWLLKKRVQGIAKIQNEKSRSAVLDAIKIDIEKAKQKVEMLHFLAVQSSPQSESFAGFWLLQELNLS